MTTQTTNMSATTTANTTTNDQRQKCEIWTRVMGYHRPVSQYNNGKKSEFYSRIYFSEQILWNQQFIKDFA